MFVSFIFLLFLGILWLVYAAVPADKRKIVLLAASYLFCGYISIAALAALVLSTAAVYAGALLIEKYRQVPSETNADRRQSGPAAKRIAAGIILLFALMLVGVKNIPYIFKMFHIGHFEESHWIRSIVLPVGFSFYAFQAIGYIYDVYRGREQADHDFVSFALYMGFFAKLVSGPIERKGKFSEQMARLQAVRVPDGGRLALAVTYLLWGYFLKLVVADRLALIVNEIYAVPSAYDTVWLLGCAVFYSFQIYTDFAGYTAIAMGCAGLFGIELTQNFRSPYLAENITEFWRCWHITLSSWLRDYVYIPLGGSRKGAARQYINLMIVFVLCGIWHGNGLSFLAWGLLHGVYSALDHAIRKKRTAGGGPKAFAARLITFLAVTAAWIFFRADSFKTAVEYYRCMLTNGIHPLVHVPFFEKSGIVMLQVYISVLLILLVQAADRICRSRSKTLPELVQDKKPAVRYMFFYACIIAIFVIGIYGGTFPTETFIYMQF